MSQTYINLFEHCHPVVQCVVIIAGLMFTLGPLFLLLRYA